MAWSHCDASFGKLASNDEPFRAAFAVMSGTIIIFRFSVVFFMLFSIDAYTQSSLSSCLRQIRTQLDTFCMQVIWVHLHRSPSQPEWIVWAVTSLDLPFYRRWKNKNRTKITSSSTCTINRTVCCLGQCNLFFSAFRTENCFWHLM